VGREVSDEDLCAFMEDRWQMRLSVVSIKRPLTVNQEAVFKRRTEDEDEEDAEIEVPVRASEEKPWRPARASTPGVGHMEIMPYESVDEAILTVIDCPPHKIGFWLPKRMAMPRVIEEFQKLSGIGGEWEGQVVQEGSPRVIKAILKVPPPICPGSNAELVQARVFFGTKLSEGVIKIQVTVEEALQIAINAERETITGQWRIQMSSEGTATASRTILAEPVLPVEKRRPLPPDIHSFVAIE
jgi:hypothetical protein